MVKTELREQVSGHSCVSDMESDSDSPTEVNMARSNGTLCARKPQSIQGYLTASDGLITKQAVFFLLHLF